MKKHPPTTVIPGSPDYNPVAEAAARVTAAIGEPTEQERDPSQSEPFDLADEALVALEVAVEAVDEHALAANVEVSRAEILGEMVTHAMALHADAMGIDLADYVLDLAANAVRGRK